MKDEQKPQPAKHTNNSFKDKEAISVVESILASHQRVMPDLKANDKWPNTDGSLEMVDEQGTPRGKFEVQVKALPEDHGYKYVCPVPFLAYCEDRQEQPILFLGVDLKQLKVFWLYMHINFLRSLHYDKNSTAKTLTFNQTQFFDKHNKQYIEQWSWILDGHRAKFRYAEAYRLIAKRSNPAIGEIAPRYINLHRFIDEVNRLLDGEFSIVKRKYYDRAWKVGVAYYKYETSDVGYVLYPIPEDKNDVEIKHFNASVKNELRHIGIYFMEYQGTNPIEATPATAAQEIVKNRALELVKKRCLVHYGNAFLAHECLIAFMDRPRGKSKPKKDSFPITEVEFRLIEESMEKFQMTDGVLIGTHSIPWDTLFEFLDCLKNEGISEVRRQYKQWKAVVKNGEKYSLQIDKDALRYNMLLFCEKLPRVYEKIIENNFPMLKQPLSLFEGAEKIVMTATLDVAPQYTFTYLKPVEKVSAYEPEVCFIEDNDASSFAEKPFGKDVEFNGKQYTVLPKFRTSVFTEIEGVTPVLDYVYCTIESLLQEYLKQR